MLVIEKSVQFNGSSKVGEKVVKVFNGNINAGGEVVLAHHVVDNALYRSARHDVMTDEESFDNAVYDYADVLANESKGA